MSACELRKIVVTGASGCIGQVLVAGLDDYKLTPLSIDTGTDLRNPQTAAAALAGHDAVVHLAWRYAESHDADDSVADSITLNNTVLHAAHAAGVRRVLMASSVHADYFFDWSGPDLLTPDRPPRGNDFYGSAKVVAETQGRYWAARGLEVIVLRYGGVTPDNTPHPTDSWEQRVFLSHSDCVAAVRSCLQADSVPGNFVIFYLVSNNPGRIHDTVNPFRWTPD